MSEEQKNKTFYTITLTNIKRKPEQILQKLETEFCVSENDTVKHFDSLPYEISKQFQTMAEAKRVIREYSKLGCTLVLNTHKNNDINEEVESKNTSSSSNTEVLTAKKDMMYASFGLSTWLSLIIFFSIVLTVSLAPVKWKTLIEANKIEGKKTSEITNKDKYTDSNRPKSKSHSLPPKKISLKQKKIVARIDINKPLLSLIKEVDKLDLTEHKKEQISEYYSYRSETGESSGSNIKENIKFLRIAISFNKKNKKAWDKLIANYQLLGEYNQEKETQRQMDVIF